MTVKMYKFLEASTALIELTQIYKGVAIHTIPIYSELHPQPQQRRNIYMRCSETASLLVLWTSKILDVLVYIFIICIFLSVSRRHRSNQGLIVRYHNSLLHSKQPL